MRCSLPLPCCGTMRLGALCSRAGNYFRWEPGSSLAAFVREPPSIRQNWHNWNGFPPEDLIVSLGRGGATALNSEPDGTIIYGHHRTHILRQRGVNVETGCSARRLRKRNF